MKIVAASWDDLDSETMWKFLSSSDSNPVHLSVMLAKVFAIVEKLADNMLSGRRKERKGGKSGQRAIHMLTLF